MASDKSMEIDEIWFTAKIGRTTINNNATYDEMKWAFDMLGWDRHGRERKRRHT